MTGFLGKLGGTVVKNSPAIVEATGSTDLIPGSGKSTGVGNSPAWKILQTEESEKATVHGVVHLQCCENSKYAMVTN